MNDTYAASTTPAVAKYVTGSALGLENVANSVANGYFSAAAGLHTGGANYLAADGHVKWYLPGKVSSGPTGTDETTQGGGTTTPPTAQNATGTVRAAATDDSTNFFALTFSPT